MLYYIDGYNVTRRDPATDHLTLETQRNALEKRMRMHSAKLLGADSTYRIVWDGAGGVGIMRRAASNSEFADTQTADDVIVEHVRASSVAVGVVTSDRDLADRCRHGAIRRAMVLPAETLFESAVAYGQGHKQIQPDTGEMGIPDDADEINSELWKIWGDEDQ